jgi:hypothetical protein
MTDPCYILCPILEIGYNIIIESILLIFIVPILRNVSHFKHNDSISMYKQILVESSNKGNSEFSCININVRTVLVLSVSYRQYTLISLKRSKIECVTIEVRKK